MAVYPAYRVIQLSICLSHLSRNSLKKNIAFFPSIICPAQIHKQSAGKHITAIAVAAKPATFVHAYLAPP